MTVFCNKCRYFKKTASSPTNGMFGQEICISSKNTVYDYLNHKVYLRKPNKINENTDCPWFEHRWLVGIMKRLGL